MRNYLCGISPQLLGRMFSCRAKHGNNTSVLDIDRHYGYECDREHI